MRILKPVILALALWLMTACVYDPASPIQTGDWKSLFNIKKDLEEIRLDIREAKDYERGTRPDFINLPLKTLKKGEFSLEGYEDVNFIVVGGFEREAEEAANILRQEGIRSVATEPGYKETSYQLVTYKTILAKDFIDKIKDDIFIIDTRSKEDYDQGHIAGAINISPEDFGDKLNQVPKKGPIYVIGYDTDRTFPMGLKDYRDDVIFVYEGMDLYDYSPYFTSEENNK